MASNLELVRPHGSMRERLIVALDVGDLGEVKELVKLLASGVGMDGRVADQVVRLALLTKEAGMDGVVASPHEVADIRSACGRRFVIVTPGIRPRDAGRNDQQRVMTPADAIQASVDYIVVGRPILAAKDPVAAARKIIAEMQGAGR